MRLAAVLVLLAALVTAGCLGPVATLYPPELQDRPVAIWVVGHGWHTGIVVRRADVSSALWRERDDFPEARYLEVGWGDRDFYVTPGAGSGLALRAAVSSAASVLHVVGFVPSAQDYFAGSEVIEVRLSRRGFDELVQFIHASYARDAGRAASLGPGLYGRSRFYAATGSYHLFYTCNTWVAGGLRAAGCPITPAYAMTAGNVMRQARQFGRQVR